MQVGFSFLFFLWSVGIQNNKIKKRQDCALLARVVRAAGRGAEDELAPSHSVYAYPKNPLDHHKLMSLWIPAAEAAVD